MDVKCVRVLRPYENVQEDNTIYIDEDARYALMRQWGDTVQVKGRRDLHDVTIAPLKEMDQEGFIARANQKLIDDLYIEYGEEVLLIH